MPWHMLKPNSKYKRRVRDPNSPARTAITTTMSTCPAAVKKQRGRPQLPYHKLKKGGRRKREYRARCARNALLLIQAAAVLDAEEQQQEHEAAARSLRLLRLERELSWRNPDASGPADLVLRTAERIDDDDECGIGSGVCDEAPLAMRCCGKLCCAPCLREWLSRNGQPVATGYGDGDYYAPVDGTSVMRARDGAIRGRMIAYPMQTHRCPFCRAPVHSVRRSLSSVSKR